MSALPEISVVIPTCNRLPLLQQAIESVFAQALPGVELIVADDGSGEATRAWLRALAARRGCTLLELPHTGAPARPRNAGVQAARGKYVAFLDSDDLWMPGKLQAQLAALRTTPAARWCYTGFLRVDEAGAPIADERRRRWTPHQGEVFGLVVNGTAAIRTPSVLAERSLLLEAGGFDETLHACEDYDLWMRLALRSPLAIADAPLVHVRLGRDSLTRSGLPVFAARDASLSKIESMVTWRHRALLRAERARNARSWAQNCAQRGQLGGALSVLAGSVGYSWPYPRWWWGAFRSLTGGPRTRVGS